MRAWAARHVGPTLALHLALVSGALAVQPDEVLADKALEARARAISSELRCLVCQNQSIDDSDADLARDLRLLVRRRLVAGDDDRQVISTITRRYGDFVRLRPPLSLGTAALWGLPPFCLITALGLLLLRRRRVRMSAPPPLTADEERRLGQLLEEGRAG